LTRVSEYDRVVLMKMKSEYQCPCCDAALVYSVGHKVDPNDGVCIECPNKECGMGDWGHGRNIKEAFEIFKQKCGK
jgi:hypothetical protein